MKYLKVWTSFRDVILPLEDEEKGRLFDMMLQYADDGEEPTDFTGNERFIWPAAKQQIDFMIAENNRLSENGKKGGRPKTNKNQTEPTKTNENQTEPNKSQKEKKINEIKINEKKMNEKFDRFWSVYPRKVAKPDAKRKFEKLNPDDSLLETMINAVEQQKKSEQWTKDNGQYIPHPSTWIHQRRWEDETVTTARPAVVAQNYDQRDYHAVQDELMRRQNERIMKRLNANNFEQRDYSDVPAQMLDDLEKEMEAFKKEVG